MIKYIRKKKALRKEIVNMILDDSPLALYQDKIVDYLDTDIDKHIEAIIFAKPVMKTMQVDYIRKALKTLGYDMRGMALGLLVLTKPDDKKQILNRIQKQYNLERLLVESDEQYIERFLKALFIRADDMVSKSYKRLELSLM